MSKDLETEGGKDKGNLEMLERKELFSPSKIQPNFDHHFNLFFLQIDVFVITVMFVTNH